MAKEKDAPRDDQKDYSMNDVMAMFAEILKQNQTLTADGLEVQREQLKQTRKKSNTKPPLISAWNPQGENFYPMPRLKCTVLMPWPQTPETHGFTWEEVELVNLLELGEYTVTLTDGTTVKANLIGTRHPSTGAITKMAFMGAIDETGMPGSLYTAERKNVMPALVAMLRDMLDQKGIKHDHVLTMAERLRRTTLPKEDERFLPVAVGE